MDIIYTDGKNVNQTLCSEATEFIYETLRHSQLLGQFRESDLGCNALDSMTT